MPVGEATSIDAGSSDGSPVGPDASREVAADGLEGGASVALHTEMVVGPAGGTVTLPSGVRLVVPEGALAAPVDLTMSSTAPTAAAIGATPVGAGVEAGPDGQQFLKPVTVVLPIDPRLVPAGATIAQAHILMAPHGSNVFVALPSTVDGAASTVQATTTHFTQFVPAVDRAPAVTDSPAPTLTQIAPTAGVEGTAQTITLTGTGFVASSVVLWDGAPIPTTVTSATQLVGTVPRFKNTPTPGKPHAVSISTPAPGGGTSTTQVFTTEYGTDPATLMPEFDVVSPQQIPISGNDAQFTVTGTNFLEGANVWFAAPGFGAESSLALSEVLSDTEVRLTLPGRWTGMAGYVTFVLTNPTRCDFPSRCFAGYATHGITISVGIPGDAGVVHRGDPSAVVQHTPCKYPGGTCLPEEAGELCSMLSRFQPAKDCNTDPAKSSVQYEELVCDGKSWGWLDPFAVGCSVPPLGYE